MCLGTSQGPEGPFESLLQGETLEPEGTTATSDEFSKSFFVAFFSCFFFSFEVTKATFVFFGGGILPGCFRKKGV